MPNWLAKSAWMRGDRLWVMGWPKTAKRWRGGIEGFQEASIDRQV